MPIKISAALLSLIIFAAVVFAAFRLVNVVTQEHDGWDIYAPVDVTTNPLLVEPAGALTTDDQDTLNSVVMAGRRDWGLPWSILVAELPGDGSTGESAEEIAARRMAVEPVESSEGAGDGLLMVVTVPEDDRARTDVAFATGPNFYPKGGISPERLAYIADVQMVSLIEEGRIGDAVVEGATWVLWTQLFEPQPNPAATNLQRGLQDLLVPLGAAGFALLAGVVAASAGAALALTLRGSATTPDPASLDGVTAAATSRGRVDRQVITGVLLDALDRGVVVLRPDGSLSASPTGTTTVRDRDSAMLEAIARLNTGDRNGIDAQAAQMRHDEVLRHFLEDAMATGGYFYPGSPRVTRWLCWIALAGIGLGVLATVIAVAGDSAPAIAAALALTVVSLVVLIWNDRRSWATWVGRRAVRDWRRAHTSADDRERVLYEVIVGMETIDLLPANASPITPGAQPLFSILNS